MAASLTTRTLSRCRGKVSTAHRRNNRDENHQASSRRPRFLVKRGRKCFLGTIESYIRGVRFSISFSRENSPKLRIALLGGVICSLEVDKTCCFLLQPNP